MVTWRCVPLMSGCLTQWAMLQAPLETIPMCPTHLLGVPHYFCGMNCVYSVVVLRPARAYIYREGQIPFYSCILGNLLRCSYCMYSVVAVCGEGCREGSEGGSTGDCGKHLLTMFLKQWGAVRQALYKVSVYMAWLTAGHHWVGGWA